MKLLTRHTMVIYLIINIQTKIRASSIQTLNYSGVIQTLKYIVLNQNMYVIIHSNNCNKSNCPSHDQITTCINAPTCKYCGPGHPTSDPLCPRYQKEKEVVTLSFEKNISFGHARSKVEAGEISYATMLKLGRVNPAFAASVTPHPLLAQ